MLLTICSVIIQKTMSPQGSRSHMFFKFYRKTPVLESTFNKVIGLNACNFIKKDFSTVKLRKLLRTPFFTKNFWWLILEGVGEGTSLVKILQYCRFNIFGINRRCFIKMLITKNNE